MKKIICLFAFSILCIGCSNNNKITINNLAIEPIHINFMAADHFIDAGATLVIKDIPNGTYTYTTTYMYPAEAKSASATGDAGSGSVVFEKKDTQILLLYAYSYFDGAYVLNVSMSSTKSSTSPTSP